VPTAGLGDGEQRATRTALTIYCGDQPWSLEHKQFPVKRQLSGADKCERAELALWVGTAGGEEHPLDPKVYSGKLAVVRMLKDAVRRGDQFDWRFGSFTVTFMIAGADPLLKIEEGPGLPGSL